MVTKLKPYVNKMLIIFLFSLIYSVVNYLERGYVASFVFTIFFAILMVEDYYTEYKKRKKK